MKLSKGFYNKKTKKIFAENKLDYYHELGHKYLDENTNISFLQDISGFLVLFTLIFCSQVWRIGAFIFYIGLQILEEAYAWKFAYKKLKKFKEGKKHETNTNK
jgi:hypothetical protein